MGQGSYGVVRKATCSNSGAEVAVKVINKKYILHNQTLTAYLESELEVLQEVTGPHVIQVITLLQDPQDIFIVTELASQGDLLQYLLKFNFKQKGLLSELKIKQIAIQLFTAIDSLHSQKIIHRDIKLENILLLNKGGDSQGNEDFDICLTDFGFAVKSPFTGTKFKPAGTRYYVAPELLKKNSNYGYKVDVWSATVVVYVLLTGQLPYTGQTFDQVQEKIKTTNPFSNLESGSNSINPMAISFLRTGMEID